MRMEAKNAYFKKLAVATGNFKNVPYSVAKRHQQLMCSYLQCEDFFERKVIKSPGINQ